MLYPCLIAMTVVSSAIQPSADADERWSVEDVNAWYAQRSWPVGCNFIPSTAINQLEMWQAETFDPDTIDRELGFARGLGFNMVRVYLHDIPYRDDPDGFLQRIDQFLVIAKRHEISPLFVLFDACWDPLPRAGKQREPKPHVHNSGWVQGPSVEILREWERYREVKPYIMAVLTRFGTDGRIFGWDLYNEPGNNNAHSYGTLDLKYKEDMSLLFLEHVHLWARDAKPQQPLTIGVWTGDWSNPAKLSTLNRFMLNHSDFISFHSYAPLEDVRSRVEALQRYGRPIVCTEYMSRPVGSTFAAIMPYLKKRKIGACNWGLVSGKTQTIYPWDSWNKTYTEEPPVWFHDILRPDSTPFDPTEVALIRELTGESSTR